MDEKVRPSITSQAFGVVACQLDSARRRTGLPVDEISRYCAQANLAPHYLLTTSAVASTLSEVPAPV